MRMVVRWWGVRDRFEKGRARKRFRAVRRVRAAVSTRTSRVSSCLRGCPGTCTLATSEYVRTSARANCSAAPGICNRWPLGDESRSKSPKSTPFAMDRLGPRGAFAFLPFALSSSSSSDGGMPAQGRNEVDSESRCTLKARPQSPTLAGSTSGADGERVDGRRAEYPPA